MANSKLQCCGCKKRFPSESMINTPIGNFHSKQCRYEYATSKPKELKQKTKDIVYKAQKKKDKYRLKELMSRGKWFKRLQILVNQWVVHVRDKDKGCYTCNTTNPSIKYDCGHRYHAGRGGGDRRRFILENLHKQCSVQCNQHGGGMPVEYDIALNIEYGEGFADELKCIANYPTLKEQFPTWQDIEEEITRYRKLLRAEGLTPISRS